MGAVSFDQTKGSKDNAARNVSVSDIGGVDIRLIAAAAVMIAVVFVMTRVVQITIGPGGYIHFGDIALYVASFLFGPLVGAVSRAELRPPPRGSRWPYLRQYA